MVLSHRWLFLSLNLSLLPPQQHWTPNSSPPTTSSSPPPRPSAIPYLKFACQIAALFNHQRERTHTYQSWEAIAITILRRKVTEEMHLLFQGASLQILQNNKVAIATRTMTKTLWYNPLHPRRDASLPDPNNSLLSAQTMETMNSCGNSFPKSGTQRDRHRHREESFFFHFALGDSTRNQSSASTETYWERFSSSKQLPPHRGHLAAAANKQAIPTKLVADLLQSLCLLTQVKTIQALVFLREEEENTRAMEKVYRKNEAPGHDKD